MGWRVSVNRLVRFGLKTCEGSIWDCMEGRGFFFWITGVDVRFRVVFGGWWLVGGLFWVLSCGCFGS